MGHDVITVLVLGYEPMETQTRVLISHPSGLKIGIVMSHERFAKWHADWTRADEPDMVGYDPRTGILGTEDVEGAENLDSD